MKTGDRVVITTTNGLAGKFCGQRGTITGQADISGSMVQLDSEKGRPRYFYFTSMRPENEAMNIKNHVKTTIDQLFPKAGATLNALAKELLVASAASTAADARKKKAKKAAIDGGLVLEEYRPGEVTSFDDAEFTVVAKTKEPTSRLDQEVLRAELSKAGLSKAKIDKAFAASLVDNKPATSYEVIQK